MRAWRLVTGGSLLVMLLLLLLRSFTSRRSRVHIRVQRGSRGCSGIRRWVQGVAGGRRSSYHADLGPGRSFQ